MNLNKNYNYHFMAVVARLTDGDDECEGIVLCMTDGGSWGDDVQNGDEKHISQVCL